MERRKDPVLKKIVLLCSVAALVAIYCFSAYSELSQLPTNLSVNEEEARSIMESRRCGWSRRRRTRVSLT